MNFSHGLVKFWSADPFFSARYSYFLSCKRKVTTNRAQNFKRAETAQIGSLGPYKQRYRAQNIATSAILALYNLCGKYNYYGGKGKEHGVEEDTRESLVGKRN